MHDNIYLEGWFLEWFWERQRIGLCGFSTRVCFSALACLLAPDPRQFLQEQDLCVSQLQKNLNKKKKCPLSLERLSGTDGSLPAHGSVCADTFVHVQSCLYVFNPVGHSVMCAIKLTHELKTNKKCPIIGRLMSFSFAKASVTNANLNTCKSVDDSYTRDSGCLRGRGKKNIEASIYRATVYRTQEHLEGTSSHLITCKAAYRALLLIFSTVSAPIRALLNVFSYVGAA